MQRKLGGCLITLDNNISIRYETEEYTFTAEFTTEQLITQLSKIVDVTIGGLVIVERYVEDDEGETFCIAKNYSLYDYIEHYLDEHTLENLLKNLV